jgi:sirohydrochlorin cobaltochelatase
MWSDFCELALYGGPPHRGEDAALRLSAPLREPEGGLDAIAEIRRGIEETTGLQSTVAAPGWLAVRCESPQMAAWLCAAIILENVDASLDGCHLLVPARSDYHLEDEVKSVITVVAKTHHYWQEHRREEASTVCRLDKSAAMRQARALHAHAT